MDVGRTLFR